MYNQFILEELKTLSDLLNTGAISQGEFDHLKQILIDGTRTAAAAEHEGTLADSSTGSPEEAIKQYMNEAKTLLVYRQFDKAYSFLQKVLVLRPEHKEALRLRKEVKSQFTKDYLIGGLTGIVVACGLSYLVTAEKDVNFAILCAMPVMLGLIMPKMISSLFSGRIRRPAGRYVTASLVVVFFALTLNVVLAGTLAQLEQMIIKTDAPVATIDTLSAEDPLANNNGNYASTDTGVIQGSNETLTAAETGKTDTNIAKEPSVAATSQGNKPEPAPENTQELVIRNILKQYYRDFNEHKFDAAKYFAPKVDRFITLKNTTPEEINHVINTEFYPEFEGAASNIDLKTLSISKLPNGYYQADFEESMNCYRKSKDQHQYIKTKVKVLFDKNMKIRYNRQETILERKFGVKASNDADGNVIYTRQ